MKLKRFLSFLLLIVSAFLVIGCGKKAQVDPIDDNYRVMYQIFVGSFSDSDGDGVGDLRGIINRLDYLNDGNINSGKSLGVQGLWLSPIFFSPSYHKYDTRDYYMVDPNFGTQEDLVELIEECHKRNVIVILDLVLNHTSSNHQWFKTFQAAHQNGNTSNKYYNYYSYFKQGEWGSGVGVTKISGTDEYYECTFSSDMPELNYDNPEVRQEVVDIAKYYLDLGIDGFRFDAVKYIYYGDTNKNVAFWDWYMDELRKIKPDIYCVGEDWSGDPEVIQYNEALNCFNFTMSAGEGMIALAARGGNVNNYTNYVENFIKQIKAKNSDAMLCSFISNHDMDRAAGFLLVSMTYNMHMAANLNILQSGSPYIYYGEEIGMKGSRGAANTDANRRLAMLWGDDDEVSNPVGSTYPLKNQTNGTVKEQLENSSSLLNYYIKLIQIRNKNPEIARGEYKALKLTDTYVGGFTSTYNDSTVCVIHNTTDSEVTIDLSTATSFTFAKVSDYIGQGTAKLDGTKLTIGPFTSCVLR